VVNVRTDTLEVNVKVPLTPAKKAAGDLRIPDDVMKALDTYRKQGEEAEQDVPTRWQFHGETLYCKPHGGGHGWRWILQCPDLSLHLGLGNLNENIAYLRFSSLLLHEHDEGEVLNLAYRFLKDLLGNENFQLQTREVHRCVDVAGWSLTQADEERFVSRGAFHGRPEEEVLMLPDVHGRGRLRRQFDFSKTAPHSCCIYDKTREVKISGKEWLYAIWQQHGWDGHSKVIRVEFRYDRECLREMGIEDPYDMLGEFDRMWAYSTQQWLRHTLPDKDTNQSRWPTSAVWDLIQHVPMHDMNAEPIVRQKKIEGDARRAMAGFVGYGVSWAVRSGLPLRVVDTTGGGFLEWAYNAMQPYLEDKKEATFTDLMRERAQRLGIHLTED
jgi:hypothetical protein